MVKKYVRYGVLCALVLLGLMLLFREPQTDRAWERAQTIPPHITFGTDDVYIENIRNAQYTSADDYTLSYFNKRIRFEHVRSVDFIVVPFTTWGAAHTFLSFGLDDGSYIALSIESRREKDESFSIIRGLFRTYELAYIIGSEHDVIGLRANHRKDDVYLYPTSATREEAEALFKSMLTRAQSLGNNPEFYNTLTNNCTTNIVRHINELREQPLSWDYRMVLPGDSDILAQELGFIAQDMSIDEARAKYRINEKAEQFANDPEFSKKIRE